MFSFKTYWRATRPKPGLAPGATIPRFETTLPAAPVDRSLHKGLRQSWQHEDYGVVLPVFPACATFMTHLKHLSDPKFPYQAMGTVHIRTIIRQVRPIRLDEVVSYHCWVEGHREVDRGVEFDMITEAIINGETVSTTIMTMYRRGGARKRDGVKPPQAVHNHISAHEASWDVTGTTARQYARLTGDINPIHLSVLTAKALGFKGMLLHGMWTFGRACAMHPVQMMAPRIQISSEFKLPIFLPATLRYRWWEDQGRLEMRVLEKNGVKPHMIATLEAMS
jgi:acyl dehydratase